MAAADSVPAEVPLRSSPLHSQLKTSRSQSERALLREALAWLQALGVEGAPGEPPPDTGALFADCWLLGRAADAVQAARRGAADAWRPPPSPLGAAPGTRPPRTLRDRINDYTRLQQICREMGLRPDVLPPLTDIEAGQGVGALAACLWELAQQCQAQAVPVPAFGDARSVLRRSMTREASARRAEKFARNGSPPKRPSIGPLLTPRAFSGKGGATLLNSGSSLRDALQRAGGHKVDARAGHAELGLAGASSGGLGRTIAALERAAADAGQSRGRPAAAGPSSQPRRRPMLPRLDIEAAAAQAAADAVEEGSSAEAEAYGGGWAADESSPSPLSSPATSSMASPSPGYASSSAASSPERRRAASPVRRPLPGHLSPSRIDNPLWSQSPASQGPDSHGAPAARPADAWPEAGRHSAEPAAAAASTSRSRSEHAPEATGTPAGSTAASPAKPADPRASFDGVGGGDGGLLESLLLPPALKPAHTQLLGALMHTAAPTAGAARRAKQPGQLHEQAEEPVKAEEPEEGAVDEAAPIVAAVAADATPAANGAPTASLKATSSEPPMAAAAAADAAPARSSRGGAGGGAGRLAMVLLSAVAGVAAAAAAGALQQRRGSSGGGSASGSSGDGSASGSSVTRRLPVLHPQPVPSMRDAERKTHVQAEQEGQRRKAGTGKASSGQPTTSARWDSAHAELTQG